MELHLKREQGVASHKHYSPSTLGGCVGVGDGPLPWGVSRLPAGLELAFPAVLSCDGPGPEEAEVCELPPPEVLQTQNPLNVSHA